MHRTTSLKPRFAIRLRFAHFIGQLAGRLLVHAAKGFLRAGDSHELDHCRAALVVGCCRGEDCSGSVLEVLTSTLESIAHEAPEDAGVLATEALIAAGVWSAAVETDPRPHPLEHWLRHGCAHVPVHDDPRADGLRGAPIMGTRVIVGAATRQRCLQHVQIGEPAESVLRQMETAVVIECGDDEGSTPDLLDPDGSGDVAEPPWDQSDDDAPQG